MNIINEWAMESADRRPLAVIVKGNPKYLRDRRVKPMAEAFYADVKERLEKRGYRVEFDAGQPYTLPNEKAKVWVGHSRGIDRLDHAPAHIKTIALQTEDHKKTFASLDAHGRDPSHYQLSEKDKRALDRI
jgi:hypothetical protein